MIHHFIGVWVFVLLSVAPVWAVTIIDVTTSESIIDREYLSDCEWLDTVEVRTTTTYQDSYYDDPQPVFFVPPSYRERVAYQGHRNPCFPDPEDKNAIIPKYCTAELLSPTGGGTGYTSRLITRNWSELVVSSDIVHHDECDGCHHTPTPEPASLALSVGGVLAVLLTQRVRGKKAHSPAEKNTAQLS